MLSLLSPAGPGPSEAQHTRCGFALSNELVGGTWCAVQTSGDADCINFSMCSSCRAAIGRYKLSLQVTCGNQVATRFLGKFVLLFNPWCSGEEEGRACLPPLPAQPFLGGRPAIPGLLSALSCQWHQAREGRSQESCKEGQSP